MSPRQVRGLLEAALDYARRGYAVFPVFPVRGGACACPARDRCEHPGKHPLGALAPHGRNDATRDEATIGAWWASWTDANVGVATGPESGGVVVVDVDPRHGGDDTLRALEAEHGALPATPEVLTGGGGRHLYVRAPADVKILSRNGALGPGLDVKGCGGYVLGDGSSHISGRVYTWEAAHHPDEVPLAAAPAWLLAAASAPTMTNGPAPRFSVPETIPEGTRNATLFALARSLRVKGLSTRGILAALEEENAARCDPPMPAAELADIVQHAVTAPDRSDFDQARTEKAEAPHLTDTGNASRFATQHAGVMRYCWPRRRFYVWTGKVWEPDAEGHVYALAKETARGMLADALQASTDEARKTLGAWALKSESEPRLRAMVDLARSEPALVVAPAALDADPWLLNVENGIINLKSGDLGPHDPAALCTKLAPVVYASDATCPRFTKALNMIFAGRGPLIEFMRRCLGYALVGVAPEQVIIVLHGLGANGKTTLLKIIHTILGPYAVSTPPESLLVKREAGIPNDLARLAGARMVSAVEVDGGRRLAENLVKTVTGGDPIVARFLNREFFEFRPTFTLFLSVNRKPRITGRDHAIWRRVRLVPFTVTIPEGEQDRTLAEQLVADEGPGILRWLVQGCLAWQREGLGLPEDVRVATAAYRSEQDTLAGFLADRCILAPGCHVGGSALYAGYAAWAGTGGEHILSRSEFREALLHRDGIVEHRTKTVRGWHGLRLREPGEPEPTDPAEAEAREPVQLW